MSWIFGTSEERKLRDLLKKAEAETSEVYGPLGNLALGIVTAAWDCYQGLAKVLEFSVEGQPTERQILVFYEMLYFFTHVTIRTAVAHRLTESQILKLQDYLGPQLSRTAVDTFCKHWPVEQKSRIADEFFERLNDAEVDYSECRGLMVKDKPFDQDSLFGRLSHNVAELWGSPSNFVVIMETQTSAAEALTNMRLVKLLDDVVIVIDRVDPDTLAALRDRPWG